MATGRPSSAVSAEKTVFEYTKRLDKYSPSNALRTEQIIAYCRWVEESLIWIKNVVEKHPWQMAKAPLHIRYLYLNKPDKS